MRLDIKSALVGILLVTCIVLAAATPPFRRGGPVQTKALVRILVQEFNRARVWDRDLKAAVAGSTSFADLKAKISALPGRPDIEANDVRDQMDAETSALETNIANDLDLKWIEEQRP